MVRDLPVIFAAFALFYALLSLDALLAHARRASKRRSTFRPCALPKYAMFSVLRIAIAYLLSLGFTLVYGYIAAYNATRGKDS